MEPQTLNPDQIMESEIHDYKEMRDSVFSAINEDGKKMLRRVADMLFDQELDIRDCSWTQYTPYYNDGSECVFAANVYDGDLYINGENVWSYMEQDTLTGAWGYPIRHAHIGRFSGKLSSMLQALGDDTLKALFGDHVRITITRDKMFIEEYEHD